MTSRHRNLHCALARALDLVGDRWTLLVVRELLRGPRRFADLQRDLPGISPNLLTERLRRLVEAGLVARTTEATATGYALTDDGHALTPAIVALTRWGTRLLRHPRGDDIFRSEWAAFALAAALSPDDGEPAVAVDVDTWRVTIGNSTDTTALRCDAMTAYQLAAGQTDLDQAIATANLTPPGNRPAIAQRLSATVHGVGVRAFIRRIADHPTTDGRSPGPSPPARQPQQQP